MITDLAVIERLETRARREGSELYLEVIDGPEVIISKRHVNSGSTTPNEVEALLKDLLVSYINGSGLNQAQIDAGATGIAGVDLNGGIYDTDGNSLSIGGSVNIFSSGKTALKAAWYGNSITNQSGRMISLLTKLSGGRIVTPTGYNFGVPGINSAQVLANLKGLGTTVAVPEDADLVFIHEASNDANTNIGCGAHYTNLSQSVQYVLGLGKTPVLIGAPPGGASSSDMNKRLSKYDFTEYLVALDNPGTIYTRPFYEWYDAQNMFLSGYSTDATHPATTYQDLWDMAARRMWQDLLPTTSYVPTIYPRSDDNSAGLFSVSNVGSTFLMQGNSLLQDGTGTGTAGWYPVTADPNIVLSTTAAPTGYKGNVLNIDFTAGITSTNTVKRRVMTNSSTYYPQATDKLMAGCFIKATGLANCQIRVYTQGLNGGYAQQDIMPKRRLDWDTEYFLTSEFTHGGTPPAQEYLIGVEITVISGTATGTVQIGGVDLYNTTALRTRNYGYERT